MLRQEPDLAQGLEPYCRHDPVTDQLRCYLRARHDVTRSQKVREYRRCVAAQTTGLRHRGQGARVDAIETRAALAAASRDCSQRGAAVGTGPRGPYLRASASRMSVERARRILDTGYRSLDNCIEMGRISENVAGSRRQRLDEWDRRISEHELDGSLLEGREGSGLQATAHFAGLCPRKR
ncbi:MAG: hypothetical protein ACYCT1_08075 [Steroidobacteraceae bacterium]